MWLCSQRQSPDSHYYYLNIINKYSYSYYVYICSLQWIPGDGSGRGHHRRWPEADPRERDVHQAAGGTDENSKCLQLHCLVKLWYTNTLRFTWAWPVSVLLGLVWHHRYQWHLQGPGDDGAWAGRHDRWAAVTCTSTVHYLVGSIYYITFTMKNQPRDEPQYFCCHIFPLYTCRSFSGLHVCIYCVYNGITPRMHCTRCTMLHSSVHNKGKRPPAAC